MQTNFKEISELYHHGIKGMKWGVIRKNDDQETRLASEKSRLKYEENKERLEKEKESELELARLDSKTAVALGKQELKKSLSKDEVARKQSADERNAKFKKYATIGSIAVLGLLVAGSVAKKAIEAKNYSTTRTTEAGIIKAKTPLEKQRLSSIEAAKDRAFQIGFQKRQNKRDKTIAKMFTKKR